MQGPNTSKRIMATIGPRKGRNQVLEGSQDLFGPILYGNLSFKRLLPEPLSLLKKVISTFLYNA
jgi:hypothetical protein